MVSERRTARVLLLDAAGRVLLVHARDGHVQDPTGRRPPGSTFWFTPGGGVAAGESVHAAAQRELLEETGIRTAQLGPAVWYGEQTLLVRDEPVLFKETFVIARTSETALSRAGWEPDEHASLLEMRWWTSAALQATSERILPALLIARLDALTALTWTARDAGTSTPEHIDLR